MGEPSAGMWPIKLPMDTPVPLILGRGAGSPAACIPSVQ